MVVNFVMQSLWLLWVGKRNKTLCRKGQGVIFGKLFAYGGIKQFQNNKLR